MRWSSPNDSISHKRSDAVLGSRNPNFGNLFLISGHTTASTREPNPTINPAHAFRPNHLETEPNNHIENWAVEALASIVHPNTNQPTNLGLGKKGTMRLSISSA